MDPRAGVTPSIRNFAHAIDRQRQALERIPVLDAQRADLEETARALDEAEAAALSVGAGSQPGRRGVVPPRAQRRGQLMPPPFRKHVFICLNERPPDSEKGDCTRKGSPQVLKKFKAALRDRGLDEEIRANKAGCLDNCENGCSVVVYPDAVWYGHVTEADVEEIVEKHLVRGEPVDALRLDKA